MGRNSVSGALRQDDLIVNPKAPHWMKDIVSRVGNIAIARSGRHRLTFRIETFPSHRWRCLKVRGVRLMPIAASS